MRMRKNVLFVISIILICLYAVIPADCQEYIIGEGDLLRITVYDHPDLTTETRVSGEGQVNFPLIGEVIVNGLTGQEIEKKIVQLLKGDYIKDPHVSVFIMEYKSKKVTVLGEFTKPGLVMLRGDSTLLEVISNAGGITPNAGEKLYIQRKIVKGGSDRNADITVVINLKKLLEEGDITANTDVEDGDSIYVPRASFVYVTGEVKSPGAYKITENLTVLKTITLAGGLTQKAGQGKIKIVRKTDNGEVTIKVRMDDLVMPDDVLMVPESIF